jgi:lysophospholipase L1-like esterase
MRGWSPFWRSVAASILTMIAVLAFEFVPVPSAMESTKQTVSLLRRTLKTRGLSAEAREEQTAGYYQELLDRSAQVVVKNPGAVDQFLGGQKMVDAKPMLEELEAGTNHVEIHERLNDFLIYRPRPSLDLRDPRFNNVRYVTNSLGFADRDYPYERLPRSRRVVFLGDSLARALGVEPGHGFEALLEDDLNAHATAGEFDRFEIINMGVPGYRITQVVDVALEVAPRFKPDAYVLVVSWLTVGRKWGLHLAQLVDEGVDPKYDFLRQVVRDADLKKGDSSAISQAKLARFMEPAMRWSLRQIKAKAEQDNAAFAVILMPHLKGIGSYDGLFNPIRSMLRSENIETIDLLGVLDDVDIATLDVGDGLHPNAAGQRMIFEALSRRIAETPSLARIFGVPVSTAPVSAPTPTR